MQRRELTAAREAILAIDGLTPSEAAEVVIRRLRPVLWYEKQLEVDRLTAELEKLRG